MKVLVVKPKFASLTIKTVLCDAIAVMAIQENLAVSCRTYYLFVGLDEASHYLGRHARL